MKEIKNSSIKKNQLLFIVNPIAGNGRASKIFNQVAHQFSQAGYSYDVLYTKHPGHATDLAKENAHIGYDSIIAVGGDGTILEVATGLEGSSCHFGIIPAGTGNDFVNAIGIKNDPDYAVKVILDHYSKPVDIGATSENRYFVNVAGVGFDTEVIRFTEKFKKFFRGMAAYLAAVLCSIFTYQPQTFTFTTEEGTFQQSALLIAIANGKTYGGGMKVAPESKCDDGYFDVIVIDSVPRFVIPAILPKFVNGKHDQIKQLKSFRCKHIEIQSSNPCPINMDGELIGNAPMKFEVKPGQLMVYCPKQIA